MTILAAIIIFVLLELLTVYALLRISRYLLLTELRMRHLFEATKITDPARSNDH